MKQLFKQTTKEMKKDLVLSDLDGTLTKKSLVLEHYGYLIRNGIVEDDGTYKAWSMDMKNEKLITECAMSYQRALIGKSINELEVMDFITEFVYNDDNWYLEVMETLEVARDFGNTDIILITGSADFLVQPLCEILGFDCFATIYKRDLKTDKLNGEIVPMFGDTHKDKCIKNNIDLHLYDDIVGFGDTSSDYGIFKNCKRNILVHPTKETLVNLITKDVKIEKIIK